MGPERSWEALGGPGRSLGVLGESWEVWEVLGSLGNLGRPGRSWEVVLKSRESSEGSSFCEFVEVL